MSKVLHIVTDSGDALARQVITAQRCLPDLEIAVVDLAVEEPDYRSLLEEIFLADSVESW